MPGQQTTAQWQTMDDPSHLLRYGAVRLPGTRQRRAVSQCRCNQFFGLAQWKGKGWGRDAIAAWEGREGHAWARFLWALLAVQSGDWWWFHQHAQRLRMSASGPAANYEVRRKWKVQSLGKSQPQPSDFSARRSNKESNVAHDQYSNNVLRTDQGFKCSPCFW